MNIGDKVVLIKDWPPARKGAKGKVVSKDQNGNLGVDTTHDHHGNPWQRLLPPAPSDCFKRE